MGGRGSAPDPAGGAYNAAPDPLAGGEGAQGARSLLPKSPPCLVAEGCFIYYETEQSGGVLYYAANPVSAWYILHIGRRSVFVKHHHYHHQVSVRKVIKARPTFQQKPHDPSFNHIFRIRTLQTRTDDIIP